QHTGTQHAATQTQHTPSHNTPHTPAPDVVHGMRTQRLPRRKSQTDSHHTKYSTTSPVQAMRLEEIARTQIFLKVAIVTCVAGVLAALITGGDPVAFNVVMAGCIVTVGGALWMYTVVRDPNFSPLAIALPAFVIGVGAFGGVY